MARPDLACDIDLVRLALADGSINLRQRQWAGDLVAESGRGGFAGDPAVCIDRHAARRHGLGLVQQDGDDARFDAAVAADRAE
jgi:hypothetical protein